MCVVGFDVVCLPLVCSLDCLPAYLACLSVGLLVGWLVGRLGWASGRLGGLGGREIQELGGWLVG